MQAGRYHSGKALYGVARSSKLFDLAVFGTPAFKPQPHDIWGEQAVVISTKHIQVGGTLQPVHCTPSRRQRMSALSFFPLAEVLAGSP